ncbi:hypothetical protein ES703_111574 [subsurface metagenome]
MENEETRKKLTEEERDKNLAEDIMRRAGPYWTEAIMKVARPDLSDAERKEKIRKILLREE